MRRYVNLADGELVHLSPVAEAKQRYGYPGGYLTMSLIDAKRLIDMRLPVDGYRLALSVATRASLSTGLVHASNAEYARELGLTAQRVSNLFRVLKAHKLIRRLERSLILVNPRWCFRGTPAQQRAAIDEWAKIHRPEIVRERQRKSA